MNFGMKLAILRTQKGYSQEKVACWLQVSAETIEKWEMGTSSPTLDQLNLISEIFGVSANELLGENPIKKPLSTEQATSVSQKKKRNKKTLFVLIFVFVILIIGGLVAGFLMFSRPFSKDTNAIAKASASVVKILCYDYEGKEISTGSGFVFKNGKTIITNYHVIETAYTAKISTDQDKTYDVYQVLNYSESKDIAILSLKEDIGLTPLKIGDPTSLEKGDPVIAIGSPLGIKNTVSQGILSGRILQNSMDILQFTAPISSGSSGGALFSEDGSVVGITFASYVNGQNLNLAIPINEAVELAKDSRPIELQSLYLQSYPYAKYLIQYKDAEKVTLEALKQNPARYANKTIWIEAYVSSFGSSLLGKNKQINLCSRKEDCSNNFEMDNGKPFKTSLLLEAIAFNDVKYFDVSSSSIGKPVLVIGEFFYIERDDILSYSYGSLEIFLAVSNYEN